MSTLFVRETMEAEEDEGLFFLWGGGWLGLKRRKVILDKTARKRRNIVRSKRRRARKRKRKSGRAWGGARKEEGEGGGRLQVCSLQNFLIVKLWAPLSIRGATRAGWVRLKVCLGSTRGKKIGLQPATPNTSPSHWLFNGFRFNSSWTRTQFGLGSSFTRVGPELKIKKRLDSVRVPVEPDKNTYIYIQLRFPLSQVARRLCLGPTRF